MQNDNFGTNFIGNLEKKSWLNRSEWYIDALPNSFVDSARKGPACWGYHQLSFRQQASSDYKFYILKEGTPRSEIIEELTKKFGDPSKFVKLEEYTPYAFTCRSYEIDDI